MKLTPDQIKKLKEPLPPESIKSHPTKTFLSSIKAIYVVERLNDVFGIGSWQLKSSVIDAETKMVVVKSILTIPEYGIELEAFGGNDNADNGDAYKGAVTDALTKICSYLEIGISVFKGLETHSNGTAPVTKLHTEMPMLPELKVGDENFNKAVKALRENKRTLADIKKKFIVHPITETVLMREVKADLVNN